MKGAVQSVSLVQVLRHCMSRIFGEFSFATHPVPVGQSVDVMQDFVQYADPASALVSTPAQTGQPEQDVTGTPSGGVGPSATVITSAADTSGVEASSPPEGAAESLEQPFCPSAQNETMRPPRPQPRDIFFTEITMPIS
jgi:hypothetical protein